MIVTSISAICACTTVSLFGNALVSEYTERADFMQRVNVFISGKYEACFPYIQRNFQRT